MGSNSHPLDTPLWSSLATDHRSLAESAGDLLRYPADVAPFLAAPPGASRLDPAALEALVRPGETVFLLGPAPSAPGGWILEALAPIAQMVAVEAPEGDASSEIVQLGDAHAEALLALTALVYPHYFKARTRTLGRYFGVLERGRLVAMAGERMGMPGRREISAVCTHPDALGRGLARALLVHLTRDLFARGQEPFLHVAHENVRAKSLYERTGWRVRADVPFHALRRAP